MANVLCVMIVEVILTDDSGGDTDILTGRYVPLAFLVTMFKFSFCSMAMMDKCVQVS